MTHSPFQALYTTLRGAQSLKSAYLTFAKVWPFPLKVQIGSGKAVFVDLRSAIGRSILANGTFDPHAIEPALACLSRGDTYLDVGANIGFYSVLASERVGPDGSVYAFEIDPRPIRCFTKTIRDQHLNNVCLVHAAVTDVEGASRFSPQREHGHNAIDPQGEGTQSVSAITLDSFAERHKLGRVKAIKIDVEGAELHVLRGAEKLLERDRPLVLCEATDHLQRFGHSTEEVISFLEARGYNVRWLEQVHTPTILAVARPASSAS